MRKRGRPKGLVTSAGGRRSAGGDGKVATMVGGASRGSQGKKKKKKKTKRGEKKMREIRKRLKMNLKILFPNL